MKYKIILALMAFLSLGAFAQEDISGTFSALLRPGNSSNSTLYELEFVGFEVDESWDIPQFIFTFTDGEATMNLVVNGSPEEEYMELQLEIGGRPYSTSVMAYGGSLETMEEDDEFSFAVLEEISLGASTMSTPTSYKLEEGSTMILINESY